MAHDPGSVTVERTGPRATVVWRRPPLQVFDLALLEELARSLRSEEVRSASVVVLKGADRRWSAGLEVRDHLSDRLRAMFRAFRDLLTAVWEVPGPTLAQVEGPCLGGGLELLMTCDLAFASVGASFGQPEVRLGVFPPLAAVLAPEAVGPKRAADLLYFGEPWTAERAADSGLVSRTLPAAMLDDEVDRAAEKLGRLRGEALRLLKKATHANGSPLGPRFDFAERVYLEELMALPKAEEGLRAFLERREPTWPPGAR